MKLFFLVATAIFAVAQVQAASYKASFKMKNPGVQCQNEDFGSHFNGRELSLGDDQLKQAFASAKSSDGLPIRTQVNGLATADEGKKCETLAAIPSVLSGVREVWVTHMEDEGKCNAYVIDEFTVSLGSSNPAISGKTAYAVVGDDYSVWSKEMCKLTEKEYSAAIKRVLATGK